MYNPPPPKKNEKNNNDTLKYIQIYQFCLLYFRYVMQRTIIDIMFETLIPRAQDMQDL